MKVHVAQVVRSQIAVWSRQEGQEIGGILLGRALRRGDQVRRVRVEAALLAEGAESVGSSIRLTPELVTKLTGRAKTEHPTFEVVGWFHTHKGLGAFFSGYDTTVHNEHFPLPWQVALVFDPVLGEEAIYIRQGNDLVPYTPEDEDRYELIPEGSSGTRYRLVNPKRLVAAVAFVLILAVAVTGLSRWRSSAPVVVPPGSEQTEPSGDKQKDPGTTLPKEQDQVPPAAGNAGPTLVTGETRYIVQPNDNLWAISKQFYGEGSYFVLIAEHNGISNPRELTPGQELLLPPAPDPTALDDPSPVSGQGTGN